MDRSTLEDIHVQSNRNWNRFTQAFELTLALVIIVTGCWVLLALARVCR